MNIEQLIDQFDLVTDTEEGLGQLRKLILDLAITGKLTKQVSESDAAQKQVNKIVKEKKELYEEGKIRKPKNYKSIDNTDTPYNLPENWVWCRLGNLCLDIHYGHTTSANKTIKTPKFLRITDIHNNTVNWDSVPGCEIEEENISKYELEDGDILIARTGGTVGKSFLVDSVEEQAIFASYLIRLIPHNFELAKYIRRFLDSGFYWNQIDESKTGTGQPNVNATKLGNLLFPFPPLEEQQHIVQQIETLFSQVDELEQKVEKDRQVDERLQVAVLDDLQSAETPEASKRSWQRLTDHFQQIYRNPEHIDQLKQAILNEAVRGRLVAQDPNDEPAEQLLGRIKEEKNHFYDENSFRRPSGLTPVKKSEIPYSIPNNWVWTRLGKLIHVSSGQNLTKEDMAGGDVPVFGGNGVSGYHDESNIDKPTVVIGRVGALCGNVHLTPSKVWVTDNAFIVYYPEDLIDQEFLIRWLRAMDLQKNVSSTAQPVISGKKIYPLLFPLPPLSEQPRIASKIKKLNSWCDDLKSTLRSSRQTGQRLLKALVGVFER